MAACLTRKPLVPRTSRRRPVRVRERRRSSRNAWVKLIQLGSFSCTSDTVSSEESSRLAPEVVEDVEVIEVVEVNSLDYLDILDTLVHLRRSTPSFRGRGSGSPRADPPPWPAPPPAARMPNR